jgi:DNA primase
MFGKKSSIRHIFLKKTSLNNPISDQKLQKAKQFPIKGLFSGNLKKTGKVYMGVCPFHKEDTPSFAIYPETNTYHCFGCGESGDVISFYMKLNNVDFTKALEELSR